VTLSISFAADTLVTIDYFWFWSNLLVMLAGKVLTITADLDILSQID